jgi:hypothetical protein
MYSRLHVFFSGFSSVLSSATSAPFVPIANVTSYLSHTCAHFLQCLDWIHSGMIFFDIIFYQRTYPKQHAMFFIPAVLVGRLFDIGFFRIPFTSGSILIVVATFLIPECKLYWHFMLCQGFGIGVGFCFLFFPR